MGASPMEHYMPQKKLCHLRQCREEGQGSMIPLTCSLQAPRRWRRMIVRECGAGRQE